jgi:hypothetical protein
LDGLYSAINKPDEAHKWRAERAKYPQGKTKTPEKKCEGGRKGSSLKEAQRGHP